MFFVVNDPLGKIVTQSFTLRAMIRREGALPPFKSNTEARAAAQGRKGALFCGDAGLDQTHGLQVLAAQGAA